jgi:hypothetical protein
MKDLFDKMPFSADTDTSVAAADSIAAMLDLSILTVRPRLTELRIMNLVFDTGIRRPNASGRNAIVGGGKTE